MEQKDAANDAASSEGPNCMTSQGSWSDRTWTGEERSLMQGQGFVSEGYSAFTGFAMFL